MNSGNSLSIAFYLYTGVTDYAVKADNPRYTFVDGIIYSKDMTRLIAIPTRYNKHMTIPEGVTTWEDHAIWEEGYTIEQYLVHSTGVSIPSTMTYIGQEQLNMLNNMNKCRLEGKKSGYLVSTNPSVTVNPKPAFTFTITVDEENPVYYTDENGYLMSRSITDYQITLSQESFAYDGTVKTPEVSVILNGKELVLDTDYTLEYLNNVNAGTASVKITGIGEYSGVSYKNLRSTL